MQTVKQLLENLQEIIALKPEAINYPIIYSIDDEGNAYHGINNNATLAQGENMTSYYIDVEGFFNGDENDEIKSKDCNCVIIN